MNLPPFEEIMHQAQAFTQRLEQVKRELAEKTVQGSAGGGMVVAVADGAGRIRSVTIEPEVLRGDDQEMLQDLICAAVNQALEASRQLGAEAQRSMTGGLPLPPGFENLLSGMF